MLTTLSPQLCLVTGELEATFYLPVLKSGKITDPRELLTT